MSRHVRLRARIERIRTIEHRRAMARLGSCQGEVDTLSHMLDRLMRTGWNQIADIGPAIGSALHAASERSLRIASAKDSLEARLRTAHCELAEAGTSTQRARARKDAAGRLLAAAIVEDEAHAARNTGTARRSARRQSSECLL